jgi:hypothetical protein
LDCTRAKSIVEDRISKKAISNRHCFSPSELTILKLPKIVGFKLGNKMVKRKTGDLFCLNNLKMKLETTPRRVMKMTGFVIMLLVTFLDK